MDAAVEQKEQGRSFCSTKDFVTLRSTAHPSKVRHYLRQNIKFKPTPVVVTIYE